MARLSRTKMGVLLAAILVLATLPLPFTPIGVGTAFHYTCNTSVVAKELLWTPWLIVAAPYGSEAVGNVSGFNATGTLVTVGPIVSTDGEVVGVFALDEWTVRYASRTLVAGPGVDEGCNTYSASVSRTSVPLNQTSYLLTLQLLGPNNTSSLGVPSQVSARGISSVIFGGDYTNMSFRDTCSGVKGGSIVSPRHQYVTIPATLPGGSVMATAQVDTSATYSYAFLGGQVWSVWAAPFGEWLFQLGSCPPAA